MALITREDICVLEGRGAQGLKKGPTPTGIEPFIK